MKLRNPLTKLITLAMAVTALVYASGLQQPVNGQTGDGSVRSVSYTSLGIVPGQTVRLSVASDERSVGTMSWSSATTSRLGATQVIALPFTNRNGYKWRQEKFASPMFGVMICTLTVVIRSRDACR